MRVSRKTSGACRFESVGRRGEYDVGLWPLPRRSKLRAARSALCKRWPEGSSLHRLVSGAGAHYRARRHVAGARIASPHVNSHSLAHPAGGSRRQRRTVRIHPHALFQTGTSANRGSGFSEGIYHNQVVLEDGVWKLWSVNVDSFYLQYPYEGGWASVKDPDPSTLHQPAPPANDSYPPDIPLNKLGDRARGFRGGTGEMIVWPSVLPMWFNYKNPVSGRVPANYFPDCVTCTLYPNTSMKNHGYLLPPD